MTSGSGGSLSSDQTVSEGEEMTSGVDVRVSAGPEGPDSDSGSGTEEDRRPEETAEDDEYEEEEKVNNTEFPLTNRNTNIIRDGTVPPEGARPGGASTRICGR